MASARRPNVLFRVWPNANAQGQADAAGEGELVGVLEHAAISHSPPAHGSRAEEADVFAGVFRARLGLALIAGPNGIAGASVRGSRRRFASRGLVHDDAAVRRKALMRADATDEHDHGEHAACHDVKSAESLHAVGDQQIESQANRETRNRCQCTAWCANQHRKYAPDEEEEYEGQLRGRAQSHVAQAKVEHPSKEGERKKDIEKRHDAQPLEEFLRTRVDKNDE